MILNFLILANVLKQWQVLFQGGFDDKIWPNYPNSFC